ncbi:glycoside hydrolase family 30 protein [Rhodococcus sp. MTM3W5.2]|uniref:glycoside hydrolase family 30 protein n=1 Tax=Rhodococcus sp. MTM3W5.2 TaxID=1805827 RepID=UPI0016770218|nr:glycoside hydrolase family 30 beta sandwich domain-containing protein [Rhodococcus sp. MTM3W5.2]
MAEWSRRALIGSVGVLIAANLQAPQAIASTGDEVSVYLTTRDLSSTLARQPDLAFGRAAAPVGERIEVDPGAKGQTLTAGFGVAMTESSAFLLQDKLPTATRNEVMRSLFSPDEGIGLSFLRIPIGATDYVVGEPATLDDQPPGGSDPSLSGFSIDRDRKYLIPAIQQALEMNPDMKVMANPWTPPAWMKSDDALVTKTGPLGHLKPEYYGAYANYLVKYLQAYRDQGIGVDYLGIQNEPLTPLAFVIGIPESFMDPIQQGILIRDHLAPALAEAGLSPGVLAYDDGFQRSEVYIPSVMGVAGEQVAGFAYHCYLTDPSSIEVQTRAYPGKEQLVTECSSKLSNVDPQQMMIRSLRAGAGGVQLWNAVLDQDGGPKMGNGCRGIVAPYAGQDCIAPVAVDTDKGTYSLTSDYWALAHFSQFIRPGSRRLASSTPSACLTTPVSGHRCGLEDVAFENPDGSRVLVVTANDGADHTFTVTESGRQVTYSLPDGATATLVWNGTGEQRVQE